MDCYGICHMFATRVQALSMFPAAEKKVKQGTVKRRVTTAAYEQQTDRRMKRNRV